MTDTPRKATTARRSPDSHTSSDPSSDAPTERRIDPAPAVVPNALGDPTVPETGNDNAETVVPGTDPYLGSAAQLGEGNLAGTDVQWPPGRVETGAAALAVEGFDVRTIDQPGRSDVEGPNPVVAALDSDKR